MGKLAQARDELVTWKESATRVHRLFHNPSTCDCVGEADGMALFCEGSGS